MLKDVIFPRFGVPRYLMTDGGSHFIHGAFRKTLAKYDVNHRVSSPYLFLKYKTVRQKPHNNLLKNPKSCKDIYK